MEKVNFELDYEAAAGLWQLHLSKNDCSEQELYAKRSKNSETMCFKNIYKWIMKNKTEKLKLEQYCKDLKVKNLGLTKWIKKSKVRKKSGKMDE